MTGVQAEPVEEEAVADDVTEEVVVLLVVDVVEEVAEADDVTEEVVVLLAVDVVEEAAAFKTAMFSSEFPWIVEVSDLR